MPRKRKNKEDEDPDWTPSSSKTKKKDNKGDCIIHCCDSNEPLTTLPSSDSWKNLLQAAEIRRDERILRLKEVLKDGEFPKLHIIYNCLQGKCKKESPAVPLVSCYLETS